MATGDAHERLPVGPRSKNLDDCNDEHHRNDDEHHNHATSPPHREDAATLKPKEKEPEVSIQTDEVRVCKDCTKKFTFSVRDQEFFAKMNFTPPVRCKPCRDKRKAEKENGNGNSRPNGNNRPLGVSASNPIREYRNRPEMPSRDAPPPPSRDDKNDGRRRRNHRQWRDDSGDSDW